MRRLEIRDYLVGYVAKFIVSPDRGVVYSNTLQLRYYYEGLPVLPEFSLVGDAVITSDGLLTFNSAGEVTVIATYEGESVSSTYTYISGPIERGVALTDRGTTTVNDSMSTVGFVACSPSTTIKWGVTRGTLGIMCEYKEDGTCNDYWMGSTSNSRSVPIQATSKQIKASFSTANLGDANIYDVTNDVYLWKGPNVE